MDTGVRHEAIVDPRRTSGREWIIIGGSAPLRVGTEIIAAWRSTQRVR